MKKRTCLDCKNRHTACHDSCLDYQREKAVIAEARKRERSAALYTNARAHVLGYHVRPTRSAGKST